ncbi:MAG: hypothetical protein ABI895_16465 [Deltaproteobacteria bacterium]
MMRRIAVLTAKDINASQLATRAQQPPDPREISIQIEHVTEALDVPDHVEGCFGKRRISEVAFLESHPILQAELPHEVPCDHDLTRLESDPYHSGRSNLRQIEGGPANTTARVQHAHVGLDSGLVGQVSVRFRQALIQRPALDVVEAHMKPETGSGPRL